MQIEGFRIQTVAERPELADQIQMLTDEEWPTFLLEAHLPANHPMPTDWFGVYKRWPHLQFALFDPASDELVASGMTLAFCYDGEPVDLPHTGWNWAMYQGKLDFEAGRTPNTLCALSATIRSAQRGKNLSRLVVQTMRNLAVEHGLKAMIAPVRPNWKARYPLIPIDEYMLWTGSDGLPFDPWMRVHARLGARVIKSCPRSMIMTGTVAEWERWTNLPMPGSGDYVISDMLTPLHIDRDRDLGLSIEPNVWMYHPLERKSK